MADSTDTPANLQTTRESPVEQKFGLSRGEEALGTQHATLACDPLCSKVTPEVPLLGAFRAPYSPLPPEIRPTGSAARYIGAMVIARNIPSC